MTNTLYLPELREMLAEQNAAELREFCTALHPARTAEFMEGLDPQESWEVLKHAAPDTRAEVFLYFDEEKQVAILEQADRQEMAQLVAELPPDERVDILNRVKPDVVTEILALVPSEERRNILRLGAYPESTAGAVMTTEFVRLSEDLTAGEALEVVRKNAEEFETVYYLYVVDSEDHLRGMLSFRQLVLARPDTRIGDLMQRAVVSVDVTDDQEAVAQKVADFDFMAIPVVDAEHHILGIITHDDIIDVVRDEATEDAHRAGAVAPLDEGYLETEILTLAWKRGTWLTFLFFAALLTAIALHNYEGVLDEVKWLVLFLPLVIATGGNSASQSATLIIAALARGDLTLSDWLRVVRREIVTGLLLGSLLAPVGFVAALLIAPSAFDALVIPVTVMMIVIYGTLFGSLLPLGLRRIGFDPALMSNPLLASIIDIVGIVTYMTVALLIVL